MRKYQSGSIGLVVVAVVLLAVVAGAIVWRISSDDETNQEPDANQTSQTDVTEAKTGDEESTTTVPEGYVLYSSADPELSFYHPSEWKLETSESSSGVTEADLVIDAADFSINYFKDNDARVVFGAAASKYCEQTTDPSFWKTGVAQPDPTIVADDVRCSSPEVVSITGSEYSTFSGGAIGLNTYDIFVPASASGGFNFKASAQIDEVSTEGGMDAATQTMIKNLNNRVEQFLQGNPDLVQR